MERKDLQCPGGSEIVGPFRDWHSNLLLVDFYGATMLFIEAAETTSTLGEFQMPQLLFELPLWFGFVSVYRF